MKLRNILSVAATVTNFAMPLSAENHPLNDKCDAIHQVETGLQSLLNVFEILVSSDSYEPTDAERLSDETTIANTNSAIAKLSSMSTELGCS